MYRTSIKHLIEWKINKRKKPLVFLGARQVGKTWLLKEFGKSEFRQMVYVNFDDKDAPKNMFLQNFDTKRIVTERILSWQFNGLWIRDCYTKFTASQNLPCHLSPIRNYLLSNCIITI